MHPENTLFGKEFIMIIQTDTSGSIEGLADCLQKTAAHPEVKGLLILSCDGNRFTDHADQINTILTTTELPLFGGIFPRIVSGDRQMEKGTIVAGLTQGVSVHIIPELSNKTIDYESVIDETIPEIDKARTMFVLVDGYATRISSLIESLFNIFGLELNFIGGGAGSIAPDVLDMAQKPCLLSNKGLLSDCALLAMLDNKSGIGVSHGWKRIHGPLKITESHGNILLSLDWRPAFSAYREIVDKFSGEPITYSNFFSIAKGFPFGISRLEQEKIVRDPFAVDDNAIIFGVDMPAETFVDILTGDETSLIQAANRAYTAGNNAYNGDSARRNILFMDCISRVLFLGDKLQEEIDAVQDASAPLIGAFTIGEIANSGKDFLEFYNKTCIVGVVED